MGSYPSLRCRVRCARATAKILAGPSRSVHARRVRPVPMQRCALHPANVLRGILVQRPLSHPLLRRTVPHPHSRPRPGGLAAYAHRKIDRLSWKGSLALVARGLRARQFLPLLPRAARRPKLRSIRQPFRAHGGNSRRLYALPHGVRLRRGRRAGVQRRGAAFRARGARDDSRRSPGHQPTPRRKRLRLRARWA